MSPGQSEEASLAFRKVCAPLLGPKANSYLHLYGASLFKTLLHYRKNRPHKGIYMVYFLNITINNVSYCYLTNYPQTQHLLQHTLIISVSQG
jgi:hypothetical protein